MGGLVDITGLTRRIHQSSPISRSREHDDPFADLTLDEQTKKSLTEYEEHRLLENVRARKHILAVEVRFDFADFDEKLRALTER